MYLKMRVMFNRKKVAAQLSSLLYGSPGGTFLLITYHLLLTTYYLSLITYNLLLITYYLLLITYHIIYNPNNGGKLHCTFPVKVVVVVVVVVEAVVVVVYV